MSSLSQRLQRERQKAARLEHEAALRKASARIKREPTLDVVSRLRADVAR